MVETLVLGMDFMIETVREIVYQIWNIILTLRGTVKVWDIIDILIMAFLVYRLLSFMQKTSASSVIKGLLLLLSVAWLANFFNMNILSYLLRQVLQMGIIVLIVLFQPEIRKMFERMGTTRLNSLFRRKRKQETIEAVLEQVIAACYAMPKTETGAIIVLERKVGLNDYAVTGVNVDYFMQVRVALGDFNRRARRSRFAVVISQIKPDKFSSSRRRHNFAARVGIFSRRNYNHAVALG